jgi:hypothetical protein
MDTHIDPADFHAAMTAGRKAWQSIRDGRRKLWSDWLVIGCAFQQARTEAMHLAAANQPVGRRYNTTMGRLLEQYTLHDIGKTARACLLRVMDKLEDIEGWRSRQPHPDDWNHPTSVWQKFSRSSKAQDQKDKKRLLDSPAALIKKLKDEIEQLTERCQELEEEKAEEKRCGDQTPNAELERLSSENEDLKMLSQLWLGKYKAYFHNVMEAGGIPRDLYVAVVNCLHPDKPTPTPEQRAHAFKLFQNWKADLEKASRAT